MLSSRPAAPLVRSAAAAALLLGGCAGTGPAAQAPEVRADRAPAGEAPADALGAFVAASRARDFETVWALLASPLRARYTPESLARDFARVEHGALERLARAELAASAPPEIEGTRARFPIADGRAVLLVLERGGWKVEALE